ncbi:MAG: XdhC/CoxI family protein [Ardenticatenia bacterium]|jgi:xanthine dehydrogenase accessory factor|nr:MAG: XdhC/CoxI family protein [Ardenticatenia bacterium]
MHDVLDKLEAWRQQGQQIGIATVISTWGSSPRPVGAKLITTLRGDIAGSVSAGCVEGAVIEACHQAIQSGQPQVLKFGVADENAWEVGLACGGTIEVMVEPFAALSGVYETLHRRLIEHQPLALVSVLSGDASQINRKLLIYPDGRSEGDLKLSDAQHKQVVAYALERLARGEGTTLQLEGGPHLFIEVYPPVPRLIIVGAVHIAEVLVPMANLLGYETIVIDPRSAFATRERFPQATQIIREYPQRVLPSLSLDRFAYLVVLTHDPKLDDPSLVIGLTHPLRYVGALGSQRTNARRIERLRGMGVSEEQLARLHAPIGLPLGGRSPAEIALSILAQITQVRYGQPV